MGADSGRPTVHPTHEVQVAATVVGGTHMQVTDCASSDEMYVMDIDFLLTSDQSPLVEVQV